jgi:hypothetical protein
VSIEMIPTNGLLATTRWFYDRGGFANPIAVGWSLWSEVSLWIRYIYIYRSLSDIGFQIFAYHMTLALVCAGQYL